MRPCGRIATRMPFGIEIVVVFPQNGDVEGEGVTSEE